MSIAKPEPLPTLQVPNDFGSWVTDHWFDVGALAVVLAFLVIGCWKGLRWQLSRFAILVVAYAAAFVAGPPFAVAIGRAFPSAADPTSPTHLQLAHHLAHAITFVAVLTGVGVVVWLFRRARDPQEITIGNRLAGGFVGSVAGALLVLAFLTFTQMFLGGGSIARAAEGSTSADVGCRALRAVERLLPAPLDAGAVEWREVLRDPALAPPPAPGRTDRSPSDPGQPEGASRRGDR